MPNQPLFIPQSGGTFVVSEIFSVRPATSERVGFHSVSRSFLDRFAGHPAPTQLATYTLLVDCAGAKLDLLSNNYDLSAVAVTLRTLYYLLSRQPLGQSGLLITGRARSLAFVALPGARPGTKPTEYVCVSLAWPAGNLGWEVDIFSSDEPLTPGSQLIVTTRAQPATFYRTTR